jgi:hypothetical protein
VHGIMDEEAKGGLGRDETLTIESTRVEPNALNTAVLGSSQASLKRHMAWTSRDESLTDSKSAPYVPDPPSSPTVTLGSPGSIWRQYRVFGPV